MNWESGIKVTVHVMGGQGARNVIMGGAAIEHGFDLDDALLRLMKEKSTFLVGTDLCYDAIKNVHFVMKNGKVIRDDKAH